MYPVLFNIYGPIAVHSYGVAIAIGLCVMTYFALKSDLGKKYLTLDIAVSILSGSIISAVIGGRALHVISEWDNYKNNLLDVFSIWNGGLSSLGAVIAMVIYFPIVLKKYKLPLLPVADIAGIYVPLFQAIARWGCVFSGCCYGCRTDMFCAITYTNPDCYAPLYERLHPTQVYSSISFFMIFLLIYYISKNYYKSPGQLIFTYLTLMAVERFFIDFLRGDRNLGKNIFLQFLSIDQWIALLIFFASLIALIYVIWKPKDEHLQLH